MAAVSPAQVQNNPTDSQRHSLLINALIEAGRPEDYDNIIRLLNPFPDITAYGLPGEHKNIKVGIIGGGLAGLSAAFELRKLGYDITIFEASEDRIGGRVYTYYFDRDKRFYGELGAMRVPVSHEISWHYINLFKLNTNLFIQSSPNAFVYVRNARAKNNSRDVIEKIYPQFDLTQIERNTPWPELYNKIRQNVLLSMSPAVRSEILRVLRKYSPQYLYYANRSIRRILELSVSEGAVELITNAIPTIGSFPYHSYGEIMHEDYTVDFVSPFQIEGGTVNLPLSFYRSLTSQNPKEYEHIPQNYLGEITWKGGNWVTGIYKSDRKCEVVLKYKNRYETTDIYQSFDYVICAIPFSTLRMIDIKPAFSNEKMQAIKEVDYIDAQKTLFLCNERFWENDDESQRIIGGASYTDLPIQVIVYPSYYMKAGDIVDPNSPGVLLASYNLSLDAVRVESTGEQYRFNLIKRQVEEVHGLPAGYLDNIVREHVTIDWNNEPWSKGAFDIFYPGQKKVFLYEMAKPEYGERVFFAGEHTSRKHAWMQGALFSGKRASNELAYYSRIHKSGIYSENLQLDKRLL